LNERQLKSSPDPVDVQIGAKLRELRLARGLVQSQLAEVAGVTFQQVYKYETGRQRVSAAMLYYFACRLGVRMDDFFEDLAASSQRRRQHH
jgi:transcriptional regulator with XRE-family HTH domain